MLASRHVVVLLVGRSEEPLECVSRVMPEASWIRRERPRLRSAFARRLIGEIGGR